MSEYMNELGQPIGAPLSRPLSVAAPSWAPMIGDHCRVEQLSVDEHGRGLFDAFGSATDHREWTYLPYGPFAAAQEFVDWLAGCAASTDAMFFTVDDGDGPCGLAAYLRIDVHAGSIEVGHIHFASRLQRTRAATEAMFLMADRAFDAGFRRYEWKCDALNAGSRSAAQRLGFTFEGTFRQAATYKGRNRDTAWYSIIDIEWPALRGEFERWMAADNFDDDGVQRTRLGVRHS